MHSRILLLTMGAIMSVSTNAEEHRTNATNAVVDVAENRLNDMKSDGPDWLKRTDISVEAQDDGLPIWSIETIQPFTRDASSTWFWQGRVGSHDDDTTVNIGTGYRWLTDSRTWLLGMNAFYDQQLDNEHTRVGLGAEAFGKYATYRMNYYKAISDRKQIKSEVYEEALDGYDVEVETPVPYLPWARFSVSGYRWEAVDALEDIDGWTAGFRLYPSSNLEVGVGATDDNNSDAKGFIELTWYLGRPEHVMHDATSGMTSNTVFQARDVSKLMLHKVRRHNEIVVERSVGSATGIVIGRRN